MKKTCTKCENEYPKTSEYFSKDSSKKDSLHSHCKLCSRKSKSEYHSRIAPEIKRKRKEAKERYISSEIYKQKVEDSKIRERIRKNKWANENRDKVNHSAKIYNSTKRIVSPEKSREYRKRAYNKMMSCPYKKAIHYYRVRVNDIIKNGKEFKSRDVILFTREEFILHIESKFKDGMNWDNHGKWHIDHIIPIKSFNLNIKNELIECWSLNNLQPLWATENLIKGARGGKK